MICPNCRTRLDDGTAACPVCGHDFATTHKISRVKGTWCPNCGALIPDGEAACPKCSSPSPNAPALRRMRHIRLPKVSDADKTSSFSAIVQPEEEEPNLVTGSALPPERPRNEDVTLGYDRMARVRVMAIAAIVSLLLVGGTIIFITHPFEPDKYDPRARELVDTSTAGSPGQLDALSGQDVRGSSAPEYDPSGAAFEIISGVYDDLGELSARLDEQEAYFLENYLLEDEQVRKDGLANASLLAIDISNAIDAVSQLGTTSDYQEDAEHMIELGNWLRNRVDVLVSAWEADLGYLAPAMVSDAIDSIYYQDKDEQGVSSYKVLFDNSYPGWRPIER